MTFVRSIFDFGHKIDHILSRSKISGSRSGPEAGWEAFGAHARPIEAPGKGNLARIADLGSIWCPRAGRTALRMALARLGRPPEASRTLILTIWGPRRPDLGLPTPSRMVKTMKFGSEIEKTL